MPNPTISAGYPKALLDFAVSRGADRQVLIERSQIRLDDLKDQDNRIPLANYLALLKASIELCNEPALSLLFGEAVRLQDISIVGMIGVAFDNVESVRRQVNRYAPLTLDADDGETADAVEFVRENGDVWMNFTSAIYKANPLLTESGFARNVCGARELAASMPKSRGRDFREDIDRIAASAGTALPESKESLGERNSLSCRIFRTCIILSRIQALDRLQPEHDAVIKGGR